MDWKTLLKENAYTLKVREALPKGDLELRAYEPTTMSAPDTFRLEGSERRSLREYLEATKHLEVE